METIRIEMKCAPEKLRELYFKNGEHIWFFGPRTRRESIGIVLLPIIMGASILSYTLYGRDDLLFIGSVICAMIAYSFSRAYFRIRRWTKDVLTFVENCVNDEWFFSYDDHCFTQSINGVVMKREWSEVQSVEMQEGEFMSLKLENSHFFLPFCCMSTKQFSDLIELVREKVKKIN